MNPGSNRNAKRAASVWNPEKDTNPHLPTRGRTDSAAARAYSAKGWGKFKDRRAWEDSLRYKGPFTL